MKINNNGNNYIPGVSVSPVGKTSYFVPDRLSKLQNATVDVGEHCVKTAGYMFEIRKRPPLGQSHKWTAINIEDQRGKQTVYAKINTLVEKFSQHMSGSGISIQQERVEGVLSHYKDNPDAQAHFLTRHFEVMARNANLAPGEKPYLTAEESVVDKEGVIYTPEEVSERLDAIAEKRFSVSDLKEEYASMDEGYRSRSSSPTSPPPSLAGRASPVSLDPDASVRDVLRKFS